MTLSVTGFFANTYGALNATAEVAAPTASVLKNLRRVTLLAILIIHLVIPTISIGNNRIITNLALQKTLF